MRLRSRRFGKICLLLWRRHGKRVTRNKRHLPHTGEDLAAVAQVILKSSSEEDYQQISKVVHQARVRWDVVLQATLGAEARGHRAYQYVEEASVRRKAKQLPVGGVPPELLRLLPNGADLG